ncbi:MAG: hypothetical protein RL582_736 [Bacteroidota bacterium]|jgi:hypothetical protein
MNLIFGFTIFFFSVTGWKEGVSQQKIKVYSKETNENLPYATVVNHTLNKFYSANVKGEVTIDAHINDSLTISFIGYCSSYFIFKGDKELNVGLKQMKRLLKQVIIHDCSRKNKMLNNHGLKQKHKLNGYTNCILIETVNTTAHLIKIPSTESGCTIKQFTFWILKDPESPEYSKHNPYRISLYKISDKDSLPGDELVENPIIISPKSYGKQTVHLDSISINIPYNGAYIMLESINDDRYSWKKKVRINSNEIKEMTTFGNLLEYAEFEELESYIYDILNNKLIKSSPSKSIRCSIDFKCCKNQL